MNLQLALEEFEALLLEIRRAADPATYASDELVGSLFDRTILLITKFYSERPEIKRLFERQFEGMKKANTLFNNNKKLSALNDFIDNVVLRDINIDFKTTEEARQNTVGSFINALSTEMEDRELIAEGLLNQGLLGFIHQSASNGTKGIFKIILSAPRDYLFTTTVEKEKLNGRRPLTPQLIGHVFTEPAPNRTQLHRFFHTKALDHLYITNPLDSLPKDYRNESAENPIYISTTRDSGMIPLYNYSTFNRIYFTPLEQNNDSASLRNQRIDSLMEVAAANKISRNFFRIPAPLDDDITISFLGTVSNFYVNPQKNKNHFTVRINPSATRDDSAMKEVDSWEEVIELFKEWIATILARPKIAKLFGDKNDPNSTPAKSLRDVEGVVLMEGPSRFKIRNDNVNPVLNVDTQAGLFHTLIESIEATETGPLLGIFGRWGRGKTFFWKALQKKLAGPTEIKFESLEFHAWKYQDTPASWAYLYELFARKFYTRDYIILPRLNFRFLNRIVTNFINFKKSKALVIFSFILFAVSIYTLTATFFFTNQFDLISISASLTFVAAGVTLYLAHPSEPKNLFVNLKFMNRIRLNFARLDTPKFIIAISYIVSSFVWYFFIDVTTKLDIIWNIITTVGLGLIVGGLIFYCRFSGLARDLVKDYFSKVSFKELLGIQAEMQKELVTLLKTWIPENAVGKMRIVLFVDDIDRCDENRIIQVIDSLKIMMDHPLISQRVIVIAAIDEIILKRAIKLKYYKMVQRDPALTESQRAKEIEQLCREYMDKLFLNGFKLGNLTSDEKVDIFRNLTENQTFFRNEKRVNENYVAPKVTQLDVDDRDVRQKASTSSTVSGTERNRNPDAYLTMQPKEEFEIMDYELEFLLKAVRKYQDATPRAIRIFYYRYLLAKAFKGMLILKGSRIFNEWNFFEQEQKAILPYLIVEYSSSKTHQELLKEIHLHASARETNIAVSCFGEDFLISEELYYSLLKVVEIVVPY